MAKVRIEYRLKFFQISLTSIKNTQQKWNWKDGIDFVESKQAASATSC